jgi:hypothetical protein
MDSTTNAHRHDQRILLYLCIGLPHVPARGIRRARVNGVLLHMKRILILALAGAIAAPVVWAAKGPQWPAGAEDKNDPQVLAFYDGMCAQYADNHGLSGADRDAFLTKCRADIPAVFPVGYAEGGGGGGE